jgi:hypothetical protein
VKHYGARGPLSDPPQLGESSVVLAWEAEAAIAKIAAAAVDQILGSDEDTRAALTQAFLEGQRDMLAKCIAAVEALDDGGDTDTRYILASTAATLRSLQEKP